MFSEKQFEVIQHALLFAETYVSYVKAQNPQLHEEANGTSNVSHPLHGGPLTTESAITLANKYIKIKNTK